MLEKAQEETPEIADAQDRLQVPDPAVRQEGSVTVVENFQAIVDALDRREDHVMRFLQEDAGTSGHIDESGRARLKGEFKAGRIEAVLDEYADAYVRCGECGLPDTRLEREQGADIVRCEACGARTPAGE